MWISLQQCCGCSSNKHCSTNNVIIDFSVQLHSVVLCPLPPGKQQHLHLPLPFLGLPFSTTLSTFLSFFFFHYRFGFLLTLNSLHNLFLLMLSFLSLSLIIQPLHLLCTSIITFLLFLIHFCFILLLNLKILNWYSFLVNNMIVKFILTHFFTPLNKILNVIPAEKLILFSFYI